jgi:hypothetical protein
MTSEVFFIAETEKKLDKHGPNQEDMHVKFPSFGQG